MGRYTTKRKRSRQAMVERATEIDARKVGGLKERGKDVGLGESHRPASSGRCKTRLLAVVSPEDLYLQENSENSACVSTSSDRVSASCCSSNGSSELAEESREFVDLEEENECWAPSSGRFVDYGERRSGKVKAEFEMESTARPQECKFHGSYPAEKMPSETELEEFFSAAEKNLQRLFIEKYNYDIVKDEPLEGRYEWVRFLVQP